MTVIDIQELPALPVGRKMVLLFWAPWHEGSSGPMTQVLNLLAEQQGSPSSSSNRSSSSDDGNDEEDDKDEAKTDANTVVVFGRVHAEEATSVSTKFKVTVVPTFIFLDETGHEAVERIEGGEDVAMVTQAVQQLLLQQKQMPTPAQQQQQQQPNKSNDHNDNSAIQPNEPKGKDDVLSKRLDRLIRSNEVMVFMKGTPTAPRCGFSRQLVELLQGESIAFGSFDILQDEAVRQGLKLHSDWPTYPQIYVHGELVGGLDILKEMKQKSDSTSGNSSLREQLGISATTAASATGTATPQQQEPQQPQPQQQMEEPLEDRLRKLIRRHRIMLFMKGLPSRPQCGFSREIVSILEAAKVAFDAFDILQDEEIRQGLKTLSEWPTYPQLYVEGELIGGLDIVKEMQADGSLQDILLPNKKNSTD